MNSCQFENIPVWSKVGKIIGWIGIAIAIVGIPLLCYSYGIETIVYAMIHKYGLYFTKVWVVILSFSYGELVCDLLFVVCINLLLLVNFDSTLSGIEFYLAVGNSERK